MTSIDDEGIEGHINAGGQCRQVSVAGHINAGGQCRQVSIAAVLIVYTFILTSDLKFFFF
jgi:hypothetical protein